MAFTIGLILALFAGISLTFVGMDRDRALYPAIMIVIACLYGLYAVIGGSSSALVIEVAVGVVFIAAAVAGFKTTLWLVAAALAAHGIFDIFHGHFINNPGVPVWWPMFCCAYDVAAALYLGLLLWLDKIPSRPV